MLLGRGPALWSTSLVVLCLGCSPSTGPRRDAAPDDTGARDASPSPVDAAAPPLSSSLAKNIIVFMGDGMGPEQLAAGRYAAGGRLRIDSLDGPTLAITDSLTTLHVGGFDPPPTDSAAGATWIATGVRVDNDVLSLTADGRKLETVLEVCQREGKATGLVTTSYFFDASPAAFASHQISRGLYPDIIREMLRVTQPDVVMGGGAIIFDDPLYDLAAVAAESEYTIVRTIAELTAWDPAATPRLLGLFSTDFIPITPGPEVFTMTPALERTESSPDPTLATMTRRALDRLSQDPEGFFLFAEDEITDSIGHRGPVEVEWANRAYPAEIAAIDEAVGVAIDWVLANSSFEETLIVVLADHETGGYRFDPLLGPESGTFTAVFDDGFSRAGLHTRRPIEVYALGPRSQGIEQIASHGDTHRLLMGTLHW